MLELNTGSLYGVLRDFHTLTKIRIVIFDAQFRELLAYPSDREAFCTMLRRTPEGEAACQSSDMGGCQTCAKTKELVIYRCHAGLTEAVVPISDQSGILAYVMFGQILTKESHADTIRAIERTYPHLSQTAHQLPVKTAAELSAAATVLQAITSFMISKRWVVPGRSEFIRQLDRYIEDHIGRSITAKDVCGAFRISRTRLYDLCAKYLGCGLAEYIRRKRIAHAEHLLLNTKLSVSDIAYAVGFSDYNHFSRIFKRCTGCSAGTYRHKKIRESK